LNEQDGLYTLLRRGLWDGRPFEDREVISSISRGIDPYTDFPAFLAEAAQEDLRFIISNTTEAGIALNEADSVEDSPPASFPGKLTRFLLERFRLFGGRKDRGFIILPCELIDRNGDTLKKIVLTHAEQWEQGPAFAEWISSANIFCNTLVDGIMTGYPKEEIGELEEAAGYRDRLFDTGELFRLWVIEAPPGVKEEFPLHLADMDVVWTEDMSPYRTRKVRILNGAHTMTVLGAYLAGKETVRDCLDDEAVAAYMRKGIFSEIIPVLPMPRAEAESFADAVLERFANPYIRHYLLSIALNSAAKFKARVLPTILDYAEKFGTAPPVLSWSFAALILFYRGTKRRDEALVGLRNGEEYLIRDDSAVLDFFYRVWNGEDPVDPEKIASLVLENTELWDEDLRAVPGLLIAVGTHLAGHLEKGVYASMSALTK
jgi:tagaturonate reductase